jgi:hypothetical protein
MCAFIFFLHDLAQAIALETEVFFNEVPFFIGLRQFLYCPLLRFLESKVFLSQAPIGRSNCSRLLFVERDLVVDDYAGGVPMPPEFEGGYLFPFLKAARES